MSTQNSCFAKSSKKTWEMLERKSFPLVVGNLDNPRATHASRSHLMNCQRMPGLIATVVLLGIAAPLHAAPATQPAGKPVVAVFDLHGELTEQAPEDQLPLFAPP